MSIRVFSGDLTVPAGTPASSPVTKVIPCPNGLLRRVQLTVPAGHDGLTGWQLRYAGTPIVPYAGATFIIANNQAFTWDISQEVQQSQLIVAAYNTGVNPHTFYCRAEVDDLAAIGPAGGQLVTTAAAPGFTAADVAGLSTTDTGAGLDVSQGEDIAASVDTTAASSGGLPAASAADVLPADLAAVPAAAAVPETAPVNRALHHPGTVGPAHHHLLRPAAAGQHRPAQGRPGPSEGKGRRAGK